MNRKLSKKKRLKRLGAETLDVLSDPVMMQQIKRSRIYFARGGKGKSFKEVFKEPLISVGIVKAAHQALDDLKHKRLISLRDYLRGKHSH